MILPSPPLMLEMPQLTMSQWREWLCLVVKRDLGLRLRYRALPEISVASVRDNLVSNFASFMLRVLTLFRASKPYWRVRHFGRI